MLILNCAAVVDTNVLIWNVDSNLFIYCNLHSGENSFGKSFIEIEEIRLNIYLLNWFDEFHILCQKKYIKLFALMI